MKSFFFNCIIVFIIMLVSCQQNVAQTDAKQLAKKVADNYGMSSFKKAKMLTYTFNVQRDTFPPTARTWKWMPKQNTVTMITPKETVTYKRDTITSAAMKSIDGKFINDQYWLVFPYHLIWDDGATLTSVANTPAPISKKNTTMLTIQYNKDGGYTPGDAYDLFINENYEIIEWNYRKSGAEKPSLSTTWQDANMYKNLKIAGDHRSADGKFRLWFTGITVD